MLAILIDIFGGYFAARHIRPLLFLLFVAALIGAFAAVASNLLIYATSSDVFTPKEIFTRIIAGVVIHPTITIIAALIQRRRIRNAPPAATPTEFVPDSSTQYRYRTPDGAEHGPVSLAALRQLRADGHTTDNTLVFRIGGAGIWQPQSQFAELRLN